MIAIFYGALSVHLGAFLLLRISPILKLSFALSAVVVAIGLITAAYAAITARVQTDIKSVLAFASLTQVGIIVAEIGFGLRYMALIHTIGHASPRACSTDASAELVAVVCSLFPARMAGLWCWGL